MAKDLRKSSVGVGEGGVGGKMNSQLPVGVGVGGRGVEKNG